MAARSSGNLTVDPSSSDVLDVSSDLLVGEREAKRLEEPEFTWSYTDEPHATRRHEIVKAHPEVKKLFGHCPLTKYKVAGSVLLQLLSVHLLHDCESSAVYWFCCYTLSGTVNHMMTLAMHELSHNLGAKKPAHNRLLGILANLPLGLPASASFRRYHMEHHRFQGEVVLDVDVPTRLEGEVFTTSTLKVLWCLLQPAFYSLRPAYINPKGPGEWEAYNLAAQLTFDALVYNCYGFWGLTYLVLGTLFGMGVHPVAGHFIAEHYVMNTGQETYSYYGPLNWLTFNVGYHNEHHDFPFIAGTNLPKVRSLAPEFYDKVPHYHSWSKVILDYIADEKIGPFSRIKRVTTSNDEIAKLKARGGLVR